MSTKNAISRRSLIVAGAMSLSAPAVALDYTVGSSLNGTSTVTGRIGLNYSGGLIFNCTATFAVSDSGGSGSITAASFAAGTGCTALRACSLPWGVGHPQGALGAINNTKITGFCLHLPSPINQTCAGTVNGTVSSGGTLTFTGSLAASPGGAVCTINSRPDLTSSPVLSIQ